MKVVLGIVGLVVLVVGGAVVYVALNSGELMKRAVEAAGEDVLRTSVTVDAVNLSMAERSGEILGLRIGNPAGFDGDYSMRFDQIKLVMGPTAEVNERVIVIERVIIDGADIATVVNGERSNLEALLDNVENSASQAPGAPVPKIIIDRFDFTNARVSVTSDILGEAELDIADVHLTDLGRRSDGVTAAEAAQQLLRPIAQAISRQLVAKGLGTDDLQAEAQRRLREKAGEAIGDELKSIAERFGHPD